MSRTTTRAPMLPDCCDALRFTMQEAEVAHTTETPTSEPTGTGTGCGTKDPPERDCPSLDRLRLQDMSYVAPEEAPRIRPSSPARHLYKVIAPTTR